MKGADEIIRRKIIGKDEKNAQKGISAEAQICKAEEMAKLS